VSTSKYLANGLGSEQFSTIFQEKAEVTLSVQVSFKLVVIIRILQKPGVYKFFKKSNSQLKIPGARIVIQILGVI